MNKNISDKDKKDWQKFISDKEKLPDKDNHTSQRKSAKSKTIDLHGYSLEDANKVIEKFILESFEQKVNKLRIVTGKGLHSQNNKDPYVINYTIKRDSPDFLVSNKKYIWLRLFIKFL